MKRFHHIEWYTGDASTMANRFKFSLGMKFIAKQDVTTSSQMNGKTSFAVQTGQLVFVFTAPMVVQQNDGTNNNNSNNESNAIGMGEKLNGEGE